VIRPSRVVDRLGLRHPGGPALAEERHATWLELFFDLVFVLALSGLIGRLAGDDQPAAGEIGTAIGIYVLVQWAWVGQAFYDTRYDPDDTVHHLMTLVATAGAGIIALGVQRAPHGELLPAGYLVVRGALLLMYLRVAASDRAARKVAAVYGAGYGAGWLLWFGSLALPEGTRPVLWIVALAVEMATPWLGRRRLNRHPVHTTHLPERLGQFTIILLGSTLASLRDAVPLSRPSGRALAAAGIAILVPIAIWWIYTTFVTSGLPVRRLGNGQVYGYLHAPAGVAVLFIGWGLGQLVRSVAEGHHTVPLTLRLVYGGSLVVWMLVGTGLHWITVGHLEPRRQLISAVSVPGMAVLAATITDPRLLLGLTAAVLVGYAALVSPQITRLTQRL
jgi:low temperature requirement protein LtrA